MFKQTLQYLSDTNQNGFPNVLDDVSDLCDPLAETETKQLSHVTLLCIDSVPLILPVQKTPSDKHTTTKKARS